jgi:3-O-alpha-D-mannopyranosyl-alpha-D-mannopyranose xylosylphosphotransferase
MDGHLPYLQQHGRNVSDSPCVLDLDSCFGSFWTSSDTVSAADMFKRLTFEKPQCGDCRE